VKIYKMRASMGESVLVNLNLNAMQWMFVLLMYPSQ
jgi:hypothetical protein